MENRENPAQTERFTSFSPAGSDRHRGNSLLERVRPSVLTGFLTNEWAFIKIRTVRRPTDLNRTDSALAIGGRVKTPRLILKNEIREHCSVLIR
jgi:hypothetical protein